MIVLTTQLARHRGLPEHYVLAPEQPITEPVQCLAISASGGAHTRVIVRDEAELARIPDAHERAVLYAQLAHGVPLCDSYLVETAAVRS